MTSNSSASMNGWGPYSGARDFNRSMLAIVFILVFVIFCFLILRATSRFLYSLRAHSTQMQEAAMEGELKEQMGAVVPARLMVFSEGMMGEATSSASECVICLCEFVEGDGLRVLPNCKHWFHERCVQAWLSCGGSCPTCRTSCASMTRDEAEKR